MNLLLANVQVDFKRCPSKPGKPGFANDLGFSSPKFIFKKQITIESKLTKNSGISIWSPRHRFCSQIAAHETKPPTKSASVFTCFFGWVRAPGGSHFIPKNRARTSRKNTLIFLFGHGNPLSKLNGWQPKKKKNTHEHPWAMSTREFTWTPLSFINDAADKLGFGQFSYFFYLLLCVVVFAFVGFIFLLVFGFSSCAGLALPKTIHCHCCKTCFFPCLGMSENEVTFFPFNVTILGSKKDTSCWDIPICSYCFGHVFLLLPCCVGLPHLKHIRLKFTDSL